MRSWCRRGAAAHRSGAEQHERRVLRGARPGGARDRRQGQPVGAGRKSSTAAHDTVEGDRVIAGASAAAEAVGDRHEAAASPAAAMVSGGGLAFVADEHAGLGPFEAERDRRGPGQRERDRRRRRQALGLALGDARPVLAAAKPASAEASGLLTVRAVPRSGGCTRGGGTGVVNVTGEPLLVPCALAAMSTTV